jgi:hypothetical protein
VRASAALDRLYGADEDLIGSPERVVHGLGVAEVPGDRSLTRSQQSPETTFLFSQPFARRLRIYKLISQLIIKDFWTKNLSG